MKKHPIPIYGGTLHVSGNTAEYSAAYRRLFQDDLGAYPNHWKALTCHRDRIILVGIFQPRYWATHACHESVHCAQSVAERVSMDPLKEEEAFAYLVQWFFDRIQEAR